tara:strand:+ start:283 stop:753 length:471 start_codon:yes stop_codon:yes gene_type:complete
MVMKKFLNSRTEKISASISLVWLVIIFASTMTGRYKDTQGFFIFGLTPLIIGWGIYYIWYEDVKRKKIDFFKFFKTKNKINTNIKWKQSRWVEVATIFGAVIFTRAFGVMGLAATFVGYVAYKFFDKKKYKKPISISIGTFCGLLSYIIFASIILS